MIRWPGIPQATASLRRANDRGAEALRKVADEIRMTVDSQNCPEEETVCPLGLGSTARRYYRPRHRLKVSDSH